jgi:hypothetical protein
MDIVFAWDSTSDGAPPGASQRCVDVNGLLFIIVNTDYLPGVRTEVTRVAAIGKTVEDFEDAVDEEEGEVGAEDMMREGMTAETIGGIVIEVEVDTMMIIVDVEDVDEVVGMADTAETDMIIEVVVDMGPRQDHQEAMVMDLVIQLVATDNLLLLLLLRR